MQELRGTGVALVTPFNEDSTINYSGLSKLVEHTIAGGVNFLVVMGTTGENVTLSEVEQRQVLDHVIKVNAHRVPIVLGMGGNNTAALVSKLSSYNLDGVKAILSVSPSYNRPTQEGIYQHFTEVAKASPLPVILYNVPGRTSSNMLPETTLRLARDFKNIIGIKEAVNDMSQVLRLLKDRPEGFLVLSGDDALALSLVSAGGDGVISVIAQGIPEEFCGLIADGLNEIFAKAYTSLYNLLPSIDLIFAEGNPAGIKSLLQHKEICERHVRLPLVAASDKLHSDIGKFLETL